MVDILSKKSVSASGEAKMKKARSLAETKNWYKDRHQTVKTQRNWLILLTFVTFAAVLVLAFQMALVADSKIFEPFVIEVDDKTGIVTKVDSKSVENLSTNKAVIQALLVKYIKAREGYQFHTFSDDLHLVWVLSSKGEHENFRYTIASAHKDSPRNLKNKASREVKIKSLSPEANKKKAVIRIVVSEKRYPNGGLVGKKHYIITIKYKFDANMVLGVQDRYLNPLGFTIVGYSRDEENIVE